MEREKEGGMEVRGKRGRDGEREGRRDGSKRKEGEGRNTSLNYNATTEKTLPISLLSMSLFLNPLNKHRVHMQDCTTAHIGIQVMWIII